MGEQKNNQLIATNKNCTACNRCISVCPVLTANHSTEENGIQELTMLNTI